MEESVIWSYENLYFIQMLAATGSKDVRDLLAAVQNAPEIVKTQVRAEEKSIKEFLAKSPELFIVENNIVSLGADSLVARKMEAEVKACCRKAIKRAGFKKNFQSMTGVLSQCKAAARAYIGGMDGLRRFFARHENTFRVQDEEVSLVEGHAASHASLETSVEDVHSHANLQELEILRLCSQWLSINNQHLHINQLVLNLEHQIRFSGGAHTLQRLLLKYPSLFRYQVGMVYFLPIRLVGLLFSYKLLLHSLSLKRPLSPDLLHYGSEINIIHGVIQEIYPTYGIIVSQSDRCFFARISK